LVHASPHIVQYLVSNRIEEIHAEVSKNIFKNNLFKKLSGHKGTHKAFSIGKLLKKNLKQADARPHHLLLLKMTVCQLNLTFLVDF
jgi:hypothetical protein